MSAIVLTIMLVACSSVPAPLRDMGKLCDRTLTELDTISSFASLRKLNWDFSVKMDELYSVLNLKIDEPEVKKYYEEVTEKFSKVQVRFGELEKKYSPNFQ